MRTNHEGLPDQCLSERMMEVKGWNGRRWKSDLLDICHRSLKEGRPYTLWLSYPIPWFQWMLGPGQAGPSISNSDVLGGGVFE